MLQPSLVASTVVLVGTDSVMEHHVNNWIWLCGWLLVWPTLRSQDSKNLCLLCLLGLSLVDFGRFYPTHRFPPSIQIQPRGSASNKLRTDMVGPVFVTTVVAIGDRTGIVSDQDRQAGLTNEAMFRTTLGVHRWPVGISSSWYETGTCCTPRWRQGLHRSCMQRR